MTKQRNVRPVSSSVFDEWRMACLHPLATTGSALLRAHEPFNERNSYRTQLIRLHRIQLKRVRFLLGFLFVGAAAAPAIVVCRNRLLFGSVLSFFRHFCVFIPVGYCSRRTVLLTVPVEPVADVDRWCIVGRYCPCCRCLRVRCCSLAGSFVYLPGACRMYPNSTPFGNRSTSLGQHA